VHAVHLIDWPPVDSLRGVTRVAVVGHVEWVDFVGVDRYPARGQVVAASEAFTRAGGGGVVAAVVLAGLGAQVDFFCALGRDANGDAAAAQLRDRGIDLQVAWRPPPTRRVITLLEETGERSIITIGERMEPLGSDDLEWERLAHADGVYLTAGDGEAVRKARAAAALVATPRARDGLEVQGLGIDALIYSASDEDERSWAQRMEPHTRLMVETEGALGGRWWGAEEGRWQPVPLPGPARDDYGCGDSFAAGFTFGLAERLPVAQAAVIGSQCGAYALTVRGAP
jgi:ribokinase